MIELTPASNAIRMISAKCVQLANSGHPGMPLGMAVLPQFYGLSILNITLQTLNGLIEIDLFCLMAMDQCYCILCCI